MNISEIIGDAIAYPLHNVKSLVIFVILGIIAALIGGTAVLGLTTAATSQGVSGFALSGVGIIGFIIFILLIFLIEGYALDIVKYGIERRDDGPVIDFARQISNAIKLIIVDFVYYIVPSIIIFLLGIFLKDWLITIISLILLIVFALANFMARCRLAKSDSLGEALAIGEAIGDISRVGLGKLIATVIIVFVIAIIIVFIVGIFSNINQYLGNIILGIAIVYLIFFYHRVIGLLYSDA